MRGERRLYCRFSVQITEHRRRYQWMFITRGYETLLLSGCSSCPRAALTRLTDKLDAARVLSPTPYFHPSNSPVRTIKCWIRRWMFGTALNLGLIIGPSKRHQYSVALLSRPVRIKQIKYTLVWGGREGVLRNRDPIAFHESNYANTIN